MGLAFKLLLEFKGPQNIEFKERILCWNSIWKKPFEFMKFVGDNSLALTSLA